MSTINPNSLDGSMVAEDDRREIEDPADKEPILSSYIGVDILKELQRELHLLDVENEFDVKVKLCFFFFFLVDELRESTRILLDRLNNFKQIHD